MFEGSNRTFMELKWSTLSSDSFWIRVLIAPLWNWNRDINNLAESEIRSNRTFMELKWEKNSLFISVFMF